MNSNGFTLVEILAVVAILGILTGLGIQAYTRYTEKARTQAFDTLAKSSMRAAEQYMFDHPAATEVNFDTLVMESYLSNADFPRDTSQQCSGTVRVTRTAAGVNGVVQDSHFIVDMCCGSDNYQYDNVGRKVKTNMCQAAFQEESHIEHNSSNCSSGNTKSKTFSIYTMDYLNRVCSKDASGKYGGCNDATNPYGNYYFPCRRYQYHQYGCKCTYSKSTGLFCSNSKTSESQHIMRIKYYETTAGYAACNSDAPGDFNSYVHDVCWEGRYASGKSVMTFHGYQFFKEKSVGYTDFRPEGTWFHDSISGLSLEDRVQRIDKSDGTIDYERGCRDTCVRFQEKISKVAA